MAATVIDTAGWRVVVPILIPLDLAGSRLTATLAGQFGGVAAVLDSAMPAAGYDGAAQIDWSADAITGLTDRLVLTVTRRMRGSWLAVGSNGRPGPVTLFADIKRTVDGSDWDPEPLGRTSFMVVPGSDSPAVASAAVGSTPVMIATQGLQPLTASSLVPGPQGPAFIPTGIDLIADEGRTFALQVVEGRLVAVRINPTGGTRGYVGALAGGGVLSGALSVISQIALAGEVANRTGPLGGLRQDPGLTGAISGAGTISGGLSVGLALAGLIANGGGPSGGMAITIPVAGSIAGSGGPSGAMTIAIPLAGTIAGSGILRGDLSTGVVLAGQVPGAGSPSGALSLAIGLGGAVPAGSGPAGSITIIGVANLAGAIAAAAGPTGSLSTAPGLNARKGRLIAALGA